MTNRKHGTLGWRAIGAAVAAVVLTLATGGVAAVAARGEPFDEPAALQQPAPDCAALTATPAQTEGPYYTPNTPQRTSLLEDGVQGTGLVVTGWVVDTECTPIAGALLDFWQADGSGQYDNRGYSLRGHQYTDEQGRYTLETVVPGLYPGRTSHIHVKVQAPGGPVLTSQLYFPDEPRNARDGIFSPLLVLQNLQQQDGGSLTATFTFVIAR